MQVKLSYYYDILEVLLYFVFIFGINNQVSKIGSHKNRNRKFTVALKIICSASILKSII